MTKDDTKGMDAYESQLLLTLAHVLENSPYITRTQYVCIERRLQEIVQIYNTKSYT